MVHPSAAHGFSSAAELYAASRPDYPAVLVDWLSTALTLGPGKVVLDLGSGTGKFLPSLVATGASVTAVEPVDAMRRQLVEAYPCVTALAGSAHSIPLPTASVHAVTCAQSFHWFADPQSVAEIHRVLAPGGSLGLIWNVRDEATPWVARLSTLLEPYEADTPRYKSGQWRTLFPSPLFAQPQLQVFPNPHTGSPAQVILGRTLSISFVAALPQQQKDEVARKVQQLIEDTPELRHQAQVTFPYNTCAYRIARIG